MKKSFKHSALLWTACLLLGATLAFSSCDGNTGATDTDADTDAATSDGTVAESIAETVAPEITYTVSVKDHAGQPVKDVVVQILKGEEEMKMKVAKADGTASFKLTEDDYTFTLSAPSGSYHYDTDACKLSPASPDATVTLYAKAEETLSIWAPSPLNEEGKQQDAYLVGEGATYGQLVGGGEMTYFIFVPTRGGIYEIGFIADGAADIGYYGMPINVFDTKLLETVEGKIEIEIRNDSVNLENPQQTGQFVFGVLPEAASTTDLIFTVTRVSDPTVRPEDLPWEEYKSTQAKAYEGQHGTTLKDLDVTDPDLTVVYNESDGYYHYGTADGPVVFIRISSASPYLDSLATIPEYTRLGVYLYDEDGKFVRKESYHQMLDAYKAVCDENGVCPLTPELEYMVKKYGEKQGWWNFSADIDIFGDKIVPQKTAWLFLCCIYE